MTRRRWRTIVLASAAVAALVVAACGVPSTDGAARIDESEIPPFLREPTTTAAPTTTTTVPPPTDPPQTSTSVAPTTTTTATSPNPTLTIYLVRDDGLLTPVPRVSPTPTPSVQEALSALNNGPTAEEVARGLTTAIPSPDLLGLLGPPDRGDVTIVLSNEFDIKVTDQATAFAQIVYTITGAPNAGVSRVFFVRDGDPTVPINFVGPGSQIFPGTSGAQREDYSELTVPPA